MGSSFVTINTGCVFLAGGTEGRLHMSIIDALRGVLPSTNRNFEERISSLEDKLDAVLYENRMLRETIDELRVCIEESQRDLSRRHRYFNGEYSSLDDGKSGKVLVAGWYGAGNFGDELMLRTILHYVPERYMDRVYVLLWDNESYDRNTFDLRCHVAHYPNSTWDVEKLADMFDAVVWGGGAILDDRQYDSNPRNFNTGNLFIRISEQMLARGKRVFALGLSTNLFIDDEEYSRRLSRIIGLTDCFSLRDPYSLKTLQDANVDCDKVVLCEDLALYNPELWELAACENDQLEKRIGVVLLCTESSYADNVRLLRLLLENEQVRRGAYRISLIPFLDEGDVDFRYYHRLVKELGGSHLVEVEPYAASLEDLAIRRCSMVVSSKYHATLIADVLRIPNICICDDRHPHYRNKMLHLSELAGVSESLFALSDLLKKDSFDRAISLWLDSSKRPCIDSSQLVEQVEWVKGALRSAFEDLRD